MDNKKETDVESTIHTLDETKKCALEFKKLLRILNARFKNLEDDRFGEESKIDQNRNRISERIMQTAINIHDIPNLIAELQNNMQKFSFAFQPSYIREEKGRALIQATDSGFDSTTYSGTSKIISGIIPATDKLFDDETDTSNVMTNSDVTGLGGIQDTNPPGNPHHSCPSLYMEAGGGNYLTIKTEKDSQC